MGAVLPVRLLDLTLGRVDANLALDERLFRRLEAGGGVPELETLRTWECAEPAVVMGRGGRREDEVDLAACAESGVPVLRRGGGGGTVLLGPGCLCFSLVLSYDRWPLLRHVEASYRLILGRVAEALGPLELAVRGGADLALGDHKVSGNAQLRGRHGLLHQGTLLHAFEPTLMSRFLTEPRRRPAYRGARRHSDFVANLPLTAPELKSRLVHAWRAKPLREDAS